MLAHFDQNQGCDVLDRVLLNVLDRVLLGKFEPITGPSVRPSRSDDKPAQLGSARLGSARLTTHTTRTTDVQRTYNGRTTVVQRSTSEYEYEYEYESGVRRT